MTTITLPAGFRIAVEREAARRNLCDYARHTWPGYQTPRHVLEIADVLQKVERGELARVIICCPPRHGKSMLVSEFFPAWYLGRNPEKYVIHATYGQELSEDFGRKVRNQTADPEWAAIYRGAAQLADDSQSAKRFTLRQGGSYFAVGAGGPVTGRGAHLLLIDDPIKGREDADSDTQRAKLKDWYRSVAYTRLMPGGAVVIIQTRWHYDDLAGWLLREHAAEGWHVVSLPAIAEDDDTLGRQPGEALWPDQYPADRLAAIRDQVGSREWASLYQQQPLPSEGAIFDLSWFRRHRGGPAVIDLKVHSWDTGIKPEEVHDPTVFQSWHAGDKGFYLMDLMRRTMAFPDLRRAVESLAARDDPHAILIEDKGSGQSLLQVLRADTRLPVIGMPANQSKVFRAQAVSPLVEAGKVFVPEVAPWLPEFEIEVQQFPVAQHDDQVDAMVHALTYLREHSFKRNPNPEAWAKIPESGRM